jgi:dihydroorotate dehydrogenase (fumarate)
MDLTTTYMGMTLKNPIVPSASPLSQNVDNIRQMEDAGASAMVMHSLFEEQITAESQQLDHFLSYGEESFAEALTYYPEMDSYVGPEEYLDLIRRAKEAVDIPIIGSLNGVSTGGWIKYAKKIEEAGANALELNVYYLPTNVEMTGTTVEQMYIDVVRDVKNTVSIPVAVKLSPFFSATANMAHRLAEEAKADALVLFNRFYQPDFELENLEVVPHLVLSDRYELRLPLRWVAILYGRVPVDFAITSGVHTYTGVLKGMMAGAKVTMMTSEILRNGVDRIGKILAEMVDWMEEHEYESVAQMQGSMSQKNVAEPAAFERANYMKVLQSWRPDPTGQLV